MRRRWRLFAGSGAGVLLLSACAQQGATDQGEAIHITLVSRDVMHGFFIPAFLFMRNAIPGHSTSFTFTPTKIGTFPAQCTEYCGLWHSRMTFVVKVVSPPDYSDWVKKKTLQAI